ncbi:MAG: N-formylglutamate amidohydrolase [Rhizobiaceae bacterium]
MGSDNESDNKTTEFNHADHPPFRVYTPAEQRVPYIFNSPHSGRNYPTSLQNTSCLTDHQLRSSEDVLVDQLFASVVEIGAPLLTADFPRAWLDVNREPYELDPKLFQERLPAHANIRSLRVAGGLGTIPRLVAENMPIYASPPSLEQAMDRIETVYRPYHQTLRSLMAQSVARFDYAVLVDCHSMPSASVKGESHNYPDIIIGDRYGTSCNGEISRELMRRFSDLGYQVARNKPYAGGFITEHYGRPLKGLHAVQIEINRSIYIDEISLQPTAGFQTLTRDIRSVMGHLVNLPDSGFTSISVAAE